MKEVREKERGTSNPGGGICVRTRNECKEGCGRLCAVLYTWCTSTPILLYISSLVRAHQPCGKRRLVVGFDFPVASRYPAPRADMPVVTLTGERRVEEVLPVLARVSMMGILEVSYPGFPDLFSSLSLSLSLFLSTSTFIPSCKQVGERGSNTRASVASCTYIRRSMNGGGHYIYTHVIVAARRVTLILDNRVGVHVRTTGCRWSHRYANTRACTCTLANERSRGTDIQDRWAEQKGPSGWC